MEIRAPRGNKLTCKSWQTEAAHAYAHEQLGS